MATPVPEAVLKWLQGVLNSNEYRDLNRTYYDVANTLQQYPSLKLRTDVYTSENGASFLLLNAQGNLPVQFRGNVYGFPISLWVPQEYPWAAPSAFIVPSQDMVLRPGQHVSGDGKIYHPYLAGWQHDRSNLIDILSILQSTFSKEPPLVAKSQHVPAPTPRPYPPGPPIPPMPPEIRRPGSELRSVGPAPPPKPPKDNGPTSKYDRPAPLPPDAQRGSTLNANSPQAAMNGDPERAELQQPMSAQVGGFIPQTGPSNWSNQQPPYGLLSPSQSTTQQTAAPAHATPGYGPPAQSYPSQGQSTFDPRQGVHKLQSPPYMPQVPNAGAYQSTPQPPPPKPAEDLLTSPFENPVPTVAANVPPPPIPPNPQKDALLSAISKILTQHVQSTMASNMNAVAPLRTQQSALTSTLNNINKEISQLEDLEGLLSSNEAILHQAMRDADIVLDDAKKRKVPDIDEVLVAPTVVAGQLYQTVAEERAIEDCRAVLGRALDKGRISSSVWAKQTRSLAREEFMKKALIKKISKGMGLIEQHEW